MARERRRDHRRLAGRVVRDPSTGVAGQILGLGLFGLPVSICVGILKYRLYDIDRIISRTLAYAVVTGFLIGVYAGLVLLATSVLAFSSSVAVAAATLTAAALFSPLRRRTQRVVDRRFNRSRYDAEETTAAFAGRLKEAVDLDSVHDDLVNVVQQVLEPAHLSVWISFHPGPSAGPPAVPGALPWPGKAVRGRRSADGLNAVLVTVGRRPLNGTTPGEPPVPFAWAACGPPGIRRHMYGKAS